MTYIQERTNTTKIQNTTTNTNSSTLSQDYCVSRRNQSSDATDVGRRGTCAVFLRDTHARGV